MNALMTFIVVHFTECYNLEGKDTSFLANYCKIKLLTRLLANIGDQFVISKENIYHGTDTDIMIHYWLHVHYLCPF